MLKDTDGVISIETESDSEGLSVYEKAGMENLYVTDGF